MNAQRFGQISKSLATTRRRTLLRGLVGAALVTLGIARPAMAEPKANLYRCCGTIGCTLVLGTPQEIKDLEALGQTCTKFKKATA